MGPSPTINSNESFPKLYYQDQGNNSAGFVTPYKINSGVSRGSQIIAGDLSIRDPSTNTNTISVSASGQNLLITDPTEPEPRIIMGQLPDKSYGMWVSKPGVDVTAATSDQLIFNSSQNVFKIIQSGTVKMLTYTTTAPASGFAQYGSSVQIKYNLSFVPIILAYATYSGTTTGIPLPQVGNGLFATATTWYTVGVTSVTKTVAQIDDSTVITGPGPFTGFGGGATIKYYLLQESAGI